MLPPHFMTGFYKALQTGLDVPEAPHPQHKWCASNRAGMIHIIGRGSSPFSEGYLIEQRAGVRRITCKPLGGRCQLVEVDTVTRQEGDSSRTFLPSKVIS